MVFTRKQFNFHRDWCMQWFASSLNVYPSDLTLTLLHSPSPHHWHELHHYVTQLSADNAGCCRLAQFAGCNHTNEMLLTRLTCLLHCLTEQSLQRSAQCVRAEDRCGQADSWPLQEQPQRFHWLPQCESNSVRCLFCVLWPALLRCQKYAEVREEHAKHLKASDIFVFELLHNVFFFMFKHFSHFLTLQRHYLDF